MFTILFNYLQKFHRFTQYLISYRRAYIIFFHLGLFILAYIAAFMIRFDGAIPNYFYNTMLRSLPLIVVTQGVFFYHYDLYQGLWRYVSFADAQMILKAVLFSLITLLILDKFVVSHWGIIPRSIYILDGLLLAGLVCGNRFLVRYFRQQPTSQAQIKEPRRILLVGPVEAAEPILREMISHPNIYLPVAMVEPNNSWEGSRLLNIPIVGGLEDLVQTARRYQVQEIIFVWPDAPRDLLNDVISGCEQFQLKVRIVPPFRELLEGRFRLADVRDIDLVDLLPRPSVCIEQKPIAGFIASQAILVTGAGGSIGSEICHQIAGFQPRRLCLLERAESSLFNLELSLKQQFPELRFQAVVGSINDGPGMHSLFQEHQPDLVFHAAAYKHVPMMERYPLEAAYNNILGTRNIAKAALATGTKRFVLISTDKAVNPSSIMGVSKRITERYTNSLNGFQTTQFLITRFGNVMGSSGSVIPLLKQQILNGGPLTLTHSEIERFFMTIPEAVQLVLQTAYMGKGGEIFVLNMGCPVRIHELAKRLCLLAGKIPGKDVEILYTGLRPGEKMSEDLFNADECSLPTENPMILRALGPKEDALVWEKHLDEIAVLVRKRDVGGLLAKFHDIVPEYRQNEIFQVPELHKTRQYGSSD